MHDHTEGVPIPISRTSSRSSPHLFRDRLTMGAALSVYKRREEVACFGAASPTSAAVINWTADTATVIFLHQGA